MMPNTENIDKTIEALRQEMALRDAEEEHGHGHFTMGDWAHFVDGSLLTQKERPTLCKTAACIAGTAVIVLEPDLAFEWEPDTDYDSGGYWLLNDDIDWSQRGQDLLGLDYDTAAGLFFMDSWPHQLLAEQSYDYDPLTGAIYLLTEIRDGRLTMGPGGFWEHPDIPVDEDADDYDDYEDDDDDEPDEDADVDEAKLERHDAAGDV
jgi:hypothetical protein